MPVFVSAFAGQVVNILVFFVAGLRNSVVSELCRPSAEVIAQLKLSTFHVRVRLMVVDGESLEGCASTGLGRVASLDNHALQLVPQFTCECRHSLTLQLPICSGCPGALPLRAG